MFLETSAKTAANVAAVFDAIAKTVAGAGASPSGPSIPALQNMPRPVSTQPNATPSPRSPPPKQPSESTSQPSEAPATSSLKPGSEQKSGSEQISRKPQGSAASLLSDLSGTSTTSDGGTEPLPASIDAAVLDTLHPSQDAPSRSPPASAHEASPGVDAHLGQSPKSQLSADGTPSTQQGSSSEHAASSRDGEEKSGAPSVKHAADKESLEGASAASQKAEPSSETTTAPSNAGAETTATEKAGGSKKAETHAAPSVTDAPPAEAQSGGPGDTTAAGLDSSTPVADEEINAVSGAPTAAEHSEHQDQKAASDKAGDKPSKSA